MIDELMQRIEEKGNPTMVGLDTTLELIPRELVQQHQGTCGDPIEETLQAILAFNKEIIQYIKDVVPAIKIQVAMYEQYGWQGIRTYQETIDDAKKQGLMVVGDIKRGDISSTAEAYSSHLRGITLNHMEMDLWKEDWITVNPYFGTDGMNPFLQKCRTHGKGLFVLVKTSNPSGKEIQDLVCGNQKVYEVIGDLVEKWGMSLRGRYGYSSVGAVVGATHREQGAILRKSMPHTFFLVPGYGAQGGGGVSLKSYFDKDGKGALIHSARGILGAHSQDKRYVWNQFGEAAREAALAMKKEVTKYL